MMTLRLPLSIAFAATTALLPAGMREALTYLLVVLRARGGWA